MYPGAAPKRDHEGGRYFGEYEQAGKAQRAVELSRREAMGNTSVDRIRGSQCLAKSSGDPRKNDGGRLKKQRSDQMLSQLVVVI